MCIPGVGVRSRGEVRSVVDVKSFLMVELHSNGGPISVPEEPLVSASAVNAAIGKSVWEMQNVVRSLDAYIEWVYSSTSDPGSAIWAWTVGIVGRVVGRSRSDVSEERTACERRKRRDRRKASVPCKESTTFVTIEKSKGHG